MGYLFLSISLLAGAIKGYCGKKTGNFASTLQSAVFLNLIRMVLCVVLGTVMVFAYKDIKSLSLSPAVLGISALSGISTSLFVVTWLISVRKSAYMMLDVFLMLGTLVPMTLSRILFDEHISSNQLFGFCILIVAVIIMCSYNNSVKVKLTVSSLSLLVICGLANGLTDFSQKTFVKLLPEMPISVFNMYTYIFSALTLAVVYCILVIVTKQKACFENASIGKYVYILIMSIALTANSYFKTIAAVSLSSAQLYPLSQGTALILSTLMASLLFKEKLTFKCVFGVVLAFLGLIVMNVL